MTPTPSSGKRWSATRLRGCSPEGLFRAVFDDAEVDGRRTQKLGGFGQQLEGLLLAAFLGWVFEPRHQQPVGIVVELFERLGLVLVVHLIFCGS